LLTRTAPFSHPRAARRSACGGWPKARRKARRIRSVVELGLSGIGWNFIFNGGTLLLANAYSPWGRTRAPGFKFALCL